MSEILNALKAYRLSSGVDAIGRIGGGNVNVTYLVSLKNGEKYILQKINEKIFPRPAALMENAVAVCARMQREKRAESLDKMRPLNIKFTATGDSYLKAASGVYRVYDFVPGSTVFSAANTPDVAFRSGEAFGTFGAMMNAPERLELITVIDGFHDFEARLFALRKALKESGRRGKEVEKIAEYLLSKVDFCAKYGAFLKKLPVRTVHNDAKINNVAFDENTGEALTVLDIDTVMDGYFAFDYGDGIRSACFPGGEDEKDVSAVALSPENFKAFSEGYLSGASRCLTEGERESFIFAPFAVTAELAARFLTDYLSGDTYFKTEYEGQNFYRARCQTALAKDMERRLPDIKKWLKPHVIL